MAAASFGGGSLRSRNVAAATECAMSVGFLWPFLGAVSDVYAEAKLCAECGIANPGLRREECELVSVLFVDVVGSRE